MGLGLVAYQGFMRGTELRLGMPLSPSPIQATLSADEENTLRGVATEVGTSALRLSLFYSDRRRDGVLHEGDNSVQLLAITGYHRTPLEWKHRHQVRERIVGGRLAFRVPQTSLAFNYLRMDWPGHLVQQPPRSPRLTLSSAFLVGLSGLLSLGAVAWCRRDSSLVSRRKGGSCLRAIPRSRLGRVHTLGALSIALLYGSLGQCCKPICLPR